MTVTVFGSAARAFADLVHQVPASAWTGPGLGEWDMRALVGHTSRSLITVSTYLKTPADHQDIDSPEHYYAMIRQTAASMGAAAIVERGRQAGRDLGADPTATVDDLVRQALLDVSAVDDPLITVIGGLGVRLHHYLPTRTFELAVHSHDIARAAGVDVRLPTEVLAEATALAGRIAVAIGSGEAVLMALTGRSGLPPAFSVV